MKKPFLLVLLLIGMGALSVGAQSFSIDLNQPIRIVSLNSTEKIYTKITNLTDADLEYTITRVEELPEGWTSSICFSQCLRPDIAEGSATLGPGVTDSFSVWINTWGDDGSGDIQYTLSTGKGDGKQSLVLVFTAISEAVDKLVVDPGLTDNYETYLTDLFPEGDLVGTWNAWMASPTPTDLAHFSEVYWLTGMADDPLDSLARSAVGSYLDNGGKLLISGQNIASDLCDTLDINFSETECAFVGDYLHATYSTDHAGATELSGLPGDGLGNGLDFAIAGGTGADNQSSPDGVTATNGGAEFLDYDGTDFAGGIRYADGATRLVYLPFGFEGIADESSRQEIFDRVAAFFADSTAPEITVGVFQNPVLTSYLDLYVIASEGLDPASIQMSVGGSDVTLSLLDAFHHVWHTDYKLQAAGAVSVALSAMDISGHTGGVETSFGVAKIKAPRGGVASSTDGVAQLTVKPGSLKRDAFIVVVSGTDRDAEWNKQIDLPEMISLTSGQNKKPSSYIFSPRSILAGESASISFRWSASRFNENDLERLAVRRLNDAEALETWVDPESRRATASINELGAFSFGPEEGTRALQVDRAYALLSQNHPNPFNPVTTIHFEIRAQLRVTLEIYDVAGRRVKSLENGTLQPGDHTAVWRGETDEGIGAPSGVYFARLVAGKTQQTRKITLIR